MAPKPKKEEDDRIPCNTPAELTHNINDMQILFAQPETEHNWEKFAKALIRLAALTRGGATKLDNYVAAVGPSSQGGLGDKIVACMLTERAALSKHALDLLSSLAPRLADRFSFHLQRLYIPPLLDLVRRTNNIIRERAEATLYIILKSCPHAGALIGYLSGACKDPNPKFRKAIARGLRLMVENWQAGGKVEEVEKVIKALISDKDVDVRKVAKELWVAYQEVWPGRVDGFAAPLSPTTQKRLEVKPSAGGSGSSSGSNKGTARVKAALKPKPTASQVYVAQPPLGPLYAEQQQHQFQQSYPSQGFQHGGPSRPGLIPSSCSMPAVRPASSSHPHLAHSLSNHVHSSHAASRPFLEHESIHPSPSLSSYRTEHYNQEQYISSAPAYSSAHTSTHPVSSAASSSSYFSSVAPNNVPATRTAVSRPAPLHLRTISGSLSSHGSGLTPTLRSFTSSISAGSNLGPPSRPVRPPGAPPLISTGVRRGLVTLGRSTGRTLDEPIGLAATAAAAAAAIPLPASPPRSHPPTAAHAIPLPPSPTVTHVSLQKEEQSPTLLIAIDLPTEQVEHAISSDLKPEASSTVEEPVRVGDLLGLLDSEEVAPAQTSPGLESMWNDMVPEELRLISDLDNLVSTEKGNKENVQVKNDEMVVAVEETTTELPQSFKDISEETVETAKPRVENLLTLISNVASPSKATPEEKTEQPSLPTIDAVSEPLIQPADQAPAVVTSPITINTVALTLPPPPPPPSPSPSIVANVTTISSSTTTSIAASTKAKAPVKANKPSDPAKTAKPSAPRVQLSVPASKAFKPISRHPVAPASATMSRASKSTATTSSEASTISTRRVAVKPPLPTLTKGIPPTLSAPTPTSRSTSATSSARSVSAASSTRSVSASSTASARSVRSTSVSKGPSATAPTVSSSARAPVSKPNTVSSVGSTIATVRPRVIKKIVGAPSSAPAVPAQPRKERVRLKPALPSFKPTKKTVVPSRSTSATLVRPESVPLPSSPVQALEKATSSAIKPQISAQMVPLPPSPPHSTLPESDPASVAPQINHGTLSSANTTLVPFSPSPAARYPDCGSLVDTDSKSAPSCVHTSGDEDEIRMTSSSLLIIDSDRETEAILGLVDYEVTKNQHLISTPSVVTSALPDADSDTAKSTVAEPLREMQLINFDSPGKGCAPTPRRGALALGQRVFGELRDINLV
ncbi:CLASP N-terminal domain [Phaffia rhodozyma]|uniref:CLASP N-terminal domain n=1 Tax=Phaffia rhodozyma TaxID=264483 RepID=A0A0F7SM24_PHARH|nr:CLASP N-terminal domain [Phaffia rhodozyma]